MRFSARSVGERMRCLRVVLFLLAASWWVAPPVAADADESFRNGMAAWDEERWADVVLHMRAAIQENAGAGGMVRLYGTRFEEYLPHFYLGMALGRIGACEESVASLEESKRQGELDGRKRRELDIVVDACQERLPPPPTVAPESVEDGESDLPLPPPPLPPPPAPADAAPSPPPPPEPPKPSPTLRRAADAYLAGDHARTLRLLDAAPEVDAAPKERATRHLLRAAAGYSLYLAGGEADAALRRAAERDARAWRETAAGIRAVPAFFSPALRAVLDGG